jgi:hypothetical protein
VAITQLTSVNTYIPQIYEDALFVARDMNLAASLVRPYRGQGFMVRNVPIWAQASAEAVDDAQDYNSPTTMSKSALATFTPGEIIAQALLTDQMMETDPDGAMQAASVELGGAVATKIDVDVFSAFSSLTADKGPGSGTALNMSYIAAGHAVVLNNKKGTPGPIYVVLHPYQWHDIWVELGMPVSTYAFLGEVANQALRDYAVGRFIGMEWYTSTNVNTSGTDAEGGVFHREALALDTRRAPRMETERDASRRATELNMTAGYGYGTHRSTYGVYITSDITAPVGS